MYKLQKFIYGLKQASTSWNIKFDQSVKSFGFIQCPDEPCVYKRRSENMVVFLVLYVDDILLIRHSENMQDSKKEFVPFRVGKSLSSNQRPKTNTEIERMRGIPYASAVESLMYASSRSQFMDLSKHQGLETSKLTNLSKHLDLSNVLMSLVCTREATDMW